MKNIFISIFLILPLGKSILCGFNIPNDERPESFFPQLDKVIQSLEEQSPVLLSLNSDIEEASANEGVAISNKGLKAGITLLGNSVHEDRPNEDFNQRYLTFSQFYVRKPLYHWGAISAQIEISRLQLDRVQSDYLFRKRTLEGETRSAFLHLVSLDVRIKLAEQQISLAHENLKNIKKKVSLGMMTNLSLEEAKIELLNKEIRLSELTSSFRKSENHFASLSGFVDKLSFVSTKDFWDFCSNHNFKKQYPALVGALNSNHIDRLQTLLDIEENRIKIAEAELRPKFNLLGSFFQDQIDSVSNRNGVDRNNFVVGVEANWQLWDSHKSRSQKKAILARKRKIERSIELKNNEIRNSIDVVISELVSLENRIKLGRNLVSVANGRLKKSKLELNQDRIPFVDFMSAQVSLDHAKLAKLEAVCKYLNLLDRYEQLISPEGVEKQESSQQGNE